MPRLSLYKPEKGNDYKFIDRQASEMFQAGGTDVYVHKYLGATTASANATADQPHQTLSPTNIQDLLFLENRDRKYDQEIYRIRGMYNVQNIDFNLSQFGLFIDNDTLYMTVHINDFIKYIGRKPISGDVLELPHLRDDFALNDFDMALPRYYVIEDVGRASEGFSVTWFPHLYRLKLKKVTDNQQFADIFNKPALDANGDPMTDGTTLKDLLSTYNQELTINDQVVAQAEADAPYSGYETRQFYTLAADPNTGKPLLKTADETDLLASNVSNKLHASSVNAVPQRTGYTGYLLGDGYPSNGYDFGFGIQFPMSPQADDFFLRTDFLPNRLFRFDGTSNAWIAVEDAVRMSMTNNDSRATLKTGFINNTNWTYNDAVASDVVTLTANATVVRTKIPFNTTGLYVVLKQDTTMLDYVVSEHTGLLTSYTYVSPAGITTNCIQINLPIITSPTSTTGAGTIPPLSSNPVPDTPAANPVSDVQRQGNLVDIAGGQQVIPLAGQWSVTLYNIREAQRQSISKVLRPKADF
jgi:hypothetical protein